MTFIGWIIAALAFAWVAQVLLAINKKLNAIHAEVCDLGVPRIKAGWKKIEEEEARERAKTD